MNNIETIIEFGSIGGDNATVWAHVDDGSLNKPLVQSLQTQSVANFAIRNSSPLIQSADDDGIQRRLPPSSTMSFLKQKRTTKAVVLTGYRDAMDR